MTDKENILTLYLSIRVLTHHSRDQNSFSGQGSLCSTSKGRRRREREKCQWHILPKRSKSHQTSLGDLRKNHRRIFLNLQRRPNTFIQNTRKNLSVFSFCSCFYCSCANIEHLGDTFFCYCKKRVLVVFCQDSCFLWGSITFLVARY